MLAALGEPYLLVIPAAGVTAAVLAGCPRLTGDNADAFRRELAQLDPAGEVHLDLSGIEYLSSAALAELVCLHRRAKDAGGRLTVVNPQPAVREVLAATRLDRLFAVEAAAA